MTATSPATLLQLLQQLDQIEDRAGRNLWLHDALVWIRGDGENVSDAAARVGLLVDALRMRPALTASFQRWWQAMVEDMDVTPLLSELGFAAQPSFGSELVRRMQLQCLPATPDTSNWEMLLHFLRPGPFDALWLRHLDGQTIEGLGLLMGGDAHSRSLDAQLLDALACCIGHIHAVGCNSDIRVRMTHPRTDAQPFYALPIRLDDFRHAFDDPAARLDAAQALRQELDACVRAASAIYTHLEQNGISVDIVFRLRQLRKRVARSHLLIDTLLAASPVTAMCRLLADLAHASYRSRSIRALWQRNVQMLSAKIAERSAESGEHYITRDRGEFRAMLGKACGGGGIIGLTTWVKFSLYGLALSPFWTGLTAGLNYAVSFVVIMLLHWTVATKQPAVTAPAMAAKLKDLDQGGGRIEGFVDEVAHLYRSQTAAIVGNLAAVVPTVLLICWVLNRWGGGDMLTADEAWHVLEDIDLRGPMALYAAFTGVLLFVSSLIAGWAENVFVLHQLESALRYHRGLRRIFGARAAVWLSGFMRRQISGLSANISLGLLLGLTPVLCQFFGIDLQVRHITLSAGQVTAAAYVLGWPVVHTEVFWWVMAGLLVIGPLNLGVSFYLAFRVAVAAQEVAAPQRGRIARALRARLRQAPLSFFLPPR